MFFTAMKEDAGMRKIDTARLVFGIITGVLALFGMVEQFLIRKDYWGTPYWMIVCWIALMYNTIRWTITFLDKNPHSHWRQIPRFLENEPILNALALNCYKWFGLVILHMIFVYIFTYPFS